MSASFEHRRSSPLPLILAGAAFALAGYTLWERLGSTPHAKSEPRVVTPRGSLAEFENSAVAVFQNNSPAVVHITSPEVLVPNGYGDVWKLPGGTGTGFVWDAQGHIVTNWHVVEQADRTAQKRVIVRFANQRQHEARVVGGRPEQDIAVIKLVSLPNKLVPIPNVGTSSDLEVGQTVFAIGNPFGYDQTLTQGIISALNRPIQAREGSVIRGCIQVDAAINPGNSGGPLLDSQGRLIGMNTAIYSPSGASAGIGFAIPVDTINLAVPPLIDPSQEPPRLGVYPREIRSDGLVMIDEVAQGSGAEEAGLRGLDRRRGVWGDVLVSVAGKPIHEVKDIGAAIAGRKRGEEVEVVVLRGLPAREEKLTVRVPLR